MRLSTPTDDTPLIADHAALDAMRYLAALSSTRGVHQAAADTFLSRWPRAVHASDVRKHLDALTTKAAIVPGSTLDSTWAGVLAMPTKLVEAVLSVVVRDSLLGRIDALRQVPFLTPVPFQNAKGQFGWVGQGAPKPVTKLGFGTVTLPPGKIVGIIAITEELARLNAPYATTTMRDALVGGIVEFQDSQMLDPAITEIANVRPASITNGVTPTTVTGDLSAKVATLLSALYASRPGTAKPVLVLSPALAGQLAATGNHASLTVSGGTAFGVPVYPTTGAGATVVALDAAATVYADGGLGLDASKDADLNMDDAPVTPTATTVLTSLWQNNLVGFKAERALWWKAVTGAVQYFTVVP